MHTPISKCKPKHICQSRRPMLQALQVIIVLFHSVSHEQCLGYAILETCCLSSAFSCSQSMSDNAGEILEQVFWVVLGEIGHLNGSASLTEQNFEIAKPKARGPVLVFDDDRAGFRVGEQRQEFATTVIDPGTNLLDDASHLIAFGDRQSTRL